MFLLHAVVPPHPGRGPEHQELQEPALADAADVQLSEEAPSHGDPSAEQPHGALVAHALPHASRLSKVCTVGGEGSLEKAPILLE